MRIYQGDCRDLLDAMREKRFTVPMIFGDPPDALGLKYDGFTDYKPGDAYYSFLEQVITKSLLVTDTFFLSYYWEHDVEVKYIVRNILKFRHPTFKAKTLIWRYTFGQYKDTDFGSGFRFILRLSRVAAQIDPAIRIESERMKIGDPRAAGPRVPDDVWDIPRVTGNSAERRSWHPTQHSEMVYDRCILSSTKPGDLCVDLFGGTGTMLRCCKRLGRRSLICELSESYVSEMEKEHSLTRISDPASPF